MTERRVVVTGLGLITPLGLNVSSTWDNLLKGKSGLRKISRFDASELSCQIAGEINKSPEDGFDAQKFIEPRDIKKMDTFMHYGIAAAVEAIEDSGWMPEDEYSKEQTGVMIGSGIGGLSIIEENVKILNEQSAKRISPFFIPASLINLVSGHISMKYGFRGPNHAVVTACATGAHAIGDAARLIKFGDADVMIAGGAEAAICPIGVAGFAALRALSTGYNDSPECASRPWDKARDGFVMGEGAGVVVLEEYEHAKKRGAKIYAEIRGYGLSGDAYHMTSPHPEGAGSRKAISSAMKHAGLNYGDIDYINAHGTSTQMGDLLELDTVQSLFLEHNSKIAMSSTKSSIGHLLGAAGSVEAIFSILAIRDQIAPATINLDDPIEEVRMDLVPNTPKEMKINNIISNSFGFGGTNATLVITKI
ncbi:MAG: fabF [Rickettsiaceae bacterium]|jgi:3-oxoacyl-[acyl-carrier-protein] synthase II|nr:fabF [Rickettsiaceae bacterium]